MIHNHCLTHIAVLLIILTCPINLQGQDERIAANETGLYQEGPRDDTGKMEMQRNPAFQEVEKDVEITLVVDVDSILDLDNADEDEILKYCRIYDDDNEETADVKNFRSQVYGGKSVKWKAKSKSKNSGKIKLMWISINNNDTVFLEEGFLLKRKILKSRITGRVKNEKKFDKKKSDYTIYFKIRRGLRKYGPYRVDPKLQANT